MNLIGQIHNGNYDMMIFDDGTKIRKNGLDFFESEYPESMDLKITNQCDMGCAFCHENSTKDGKHGDIMNLKFIETLLPYTELAIGGGNLLAHPNLIGFLQKCRKHRLICNITINQVHFLQNEDFIRSLVDSKLICGLGVSLVNITDEFIQKIKRYPNAVIHVINGIHTVEDLEKLYDKDLKILILGYKEFRRGKSFYNEKIEMEKEKISKAISEITEHFAVVSFDNLALEQLKIKSILSEDEWNEFFMGDDGTHTMFIDAVENTFSTSSTTPVEKRHKLLDNILPMFNIIKEEYRGEKT